MPIFSHTFPSVERHAEKLPSSLQSLVVETVFSNFIPEKTSYFISDKIIIYTSTNVKGSLLFGLIPLDPLRNAESIHLLSFLKEITLNTSFPAMFQLINQVMPFGTPIVSDRFLADALRTKYDFYKFGYELVKDIASWKSCLYSLQSKLSFKVNETIVGSISSKKSTWQIFGELISQCSTKYFPTVSLTLSSFSSMKFFATHHCVKSFHDGKLEFCPPNGQLQLMFWECISDQCNPPLTGKLDVEELGNNSIMATFSLNSIRQIKITLIELFFPCRGEITNLEMLQKPDGKQTMKKKEAKIFLRGLSTEANMTCKLMFEKEYKGDEKAKAFITMSNNSSFSGIAIQETVIDDSSSNELITSSSFQSNPSKFFILQTE